MTLKKSINLIVILITVLFIIRMVVEILSCIQWVKYVNAPNPFFSEYAFNYLIKENRMFVEEIVNITRLSFIYGLIMLVYLGVSLIAKSEKNI